MGGSAEANGGAVRVPVPPARPFLDTFRGNLKETFFPDDPFRGVVRERGAGRRTVAALRYFFPFLEWAPAYRLGTFKSDLIAGITIASLAIPQGISYAKLANLPPIIGLCMRAMHLFSGLNSSARTSAFSAITTIDVDVRLCTRSPQAH